MVLDYAEIPSQIKEMTQRMAVAEDIMFVSGLDFLAIVSCGIEFTMAEYMLKHTAPVLSKYLEKVYDIYLRRGFTVDLFLMNHAFECLCDNTAGASDLKATALKYNVEDIDHNIRIIKEWARAI